MILHMHVFHACKLNWLCISLVYWTHVLCTDMHETVCCFYIPFSLLLITNVSNKCIKSEQKAVKVHISLDTRIHACFCTCTCSMHAHEMYKSSVLISINTLNSLLLLYSIQLHKANVSKYVIFLSMFLHRYVSNACRLNALCIVY